MQLSFRHCRHGAKRQRFDLALVLLALAIDEGSGMILLSTVRADSGEVAAVVRELLAAGLIEELPVAEAEQAWRTDGGVRYGFRVTERGLRFVGYPPLRSCVAASA